jgi:uncharacterized membrane protein YkvA (DUF1232 family)
MKFPSIRLLYYFLIIFKQYAISHVSLIPNFIPVPGYLYDLIVVPLEIVFALKMIPKEILVECREKVKNGTLNTKIKWIGAIIIISI